MKMKKHIVVLTMAILAIAMPAVSQTIFEVPNVEFRSKDDYSYYEKDIIKAAKWLEENDLDFQVKKREQVNAFVLKWLAGSSSVSINYTDKLAKVTDRNPLLGSLLLAVFARTILENKTSATYFDAIKAGLQAVVRVYKKGINVKKEKELDKLAAFTDDTQLEDYIRNTLKIPKL
jgi:hypothetical protein